MQIVNELLRAASESSAALRSRISGVRPGPIVDGRETVRFRLDEIECEVPQSPREAVVGIRDEADVRIAARSLLDAPPEIVEEISKRLRRAAGVTVRKSFREIAEIAEKSPGYAVVVVDNGVRFSLSEIRFRRRPNGRRDRAVVECQSNGRAAAFMSDDVASVAD